VKQVASRALLATCDMFLQIVGLLSTDYAVLYSRKYNTSFWELFISEWQWKLERLEKTCYNIACPAQYHLHYQLLMLRMLFYK
jgi:hypothetical protein